jgi:hypothetical protein
MSRPVARHALGNCGSRPIPDGAHSSAQRPLQLHTSRRRRDRRVTKRSGRAELSPSQVQGFHDDLSQAQSFAEQRSRTEFVPMSWISCRSSLDLAIRIQCSLGAHDAHDLRTLERGAQAHRPGNIPVGMEPERSVGFTISPNQGVHP